MQLSENAHRVLQARYLRRDSQGQINETPEQLFACVARSRLPTPSCCWAIVNGLLSGRSAFLPC